MDFNFFFFFFFDRSNETRAIDVKMDGFVLEEIPSFMMQVSLLLKLPPRKLDP